MQDSYTTLSGASRVETKIRGSRFIAIAEPIRAREDVHVLLARIRKEFHDATHHCYAYRIGPAGSDFRASDGGEPAGSAGKPILAALEKAGITDVAVVVTRYFGGTKLGVGGLARAYRESAARAIAGGVPLIRYTIETVVARFSHGQISNVMHVVAKTGARIVDTFYDDEVHLRLEIRSSHAMELRTSLVEKTGGDITVS